MIPKIIYTTWISPEPYPEKYKPFLEGWKKLMPDYEIRVINLDNLVRNNWTATALLNCKFALAGHYGRLERLYETGGLYFDIDIEAVKNFDTLLDNKIFIGREDKGMVNNAVIGSEPHDPFIKECMEATLATDIYIPNVELETGPWLFNKLYTKHDIKVFPEEYFYPYHYTKSFTPDCVKENTYAIHHWAKTWGE